LRGKNVYEHSRKLSTRKTTEKDVLKNWKEKIFSKIQEIFSSCVGESVFFRRAVSLNGIVDKKIFGFRIKITVFSNGKLTPRLAAWRLHSRPIKRVCLLAT